MPIETTTSAAQFGVNSLLSMPRQCGWCGMIHGPRCASVQAIEYYPDGTVKRVEFVQPQVIHATPTAVEVIDWGKRYSIP